MIKKRMTLISKYLFLALIVLLFLLPMFYMLANSVMQSSEIVEAYTTSQDHYAHFKLIPDKFSLEQYYQVFLRRPGFLKLIQIFLLATIIFNTCSQSQ